VVELGKLANLLDFVKKTWAEKYRPKTLDEIVGHEEIGRELKGYVASCNCPT